MSGSVLGLALVIATVAGTGGVLPLCAAMVGSARVAGAADAAALAAADSASGHSPGLPCDAATTMATANGATVRSCTVDGMVVTVVLELRLGALALRSTSTAGPPR